MARASRRLSSHERASAQPGWPGRAGAAFLLALALIAGAGCALAQSDFARTAGNAGAAFAAAAVTLRFAHEGKLTVVYARASFVNYRAELDGLDAQLPAQDGAPDARTLRRLLNLADPALRAVDAPCLDVSADASADASADGGCDWRGQVAALERASVALLKAGGS